MCVNVDFRSGHMISHTTSNPPNFAKENKKPSLLVQDKQIRKWDEIQIWSSLR